MQTGVPEGTTDPAIAVQQALQFVAPALGAFIVASIILFAIVVMIVLLAQVFE